MNFKDFNKKCGQISAKQSAIIDQIVSEVTDLIMKNAFESEEGRIDWQKVDNELKSAAESAKEIGETEDMFAFMFSRIGMLEVFRRMTED